MAFEMVFPEQDATEAMAPNMERDAMVVKGSPAWRDRRKALNYTEVRVVDPELTSFAVNYTRQLPFIHQDACTPIPSETRGGVYGAYDFESMLDDEAQVVSPEAGYARGGLKRSKDNFLTIARGLEVPISDMITAESAPAAMVRDSVTRHVARSCDRTREKAYARVLFDGLAHGAAGAWGGVAKGIPGVTNPAFNPYSGTAAERQFQQWSVSTSDPLRAISMMADAMESRIGYLPNTLVLGALIPAQLVQVDDILDRVNRGQTSGQAEGSVRQVSEFITDLYGIPDFRIYQLRTIDTVGKFLNPKDAWLGYVSRTPDTMSPTAIANFYWDAWGGAQTTIDTYRRQSTNTEYVRGAYANVFKKVTPAAGVRMETVVA